MTDEQLSFALANVNADSNARLFADFTMQRTSINLTTLRQLCGKQQSGVRPSMFTIGTTIIIAPNITGLHATVMEPEVNLPTDFLEAGGLRNFTIVIPDFGPTYIPSDTLPRITTNDKQLTISDVRPIDAPTSSSRRQVATAQHYYQATLTVDPKKRGNTTTQVSVVMAKYLQVWNFSVTVPVRLPAMATSYFLYRGYQLSVGVQITNGSQLHLPAMTFDTYNTLVPVTLTPTNDGCEWNQAALRVTCNSSVILHRSNNFSESLYFDVQVMVPAYYNGDVNVTATSFAENADTIVSTFIVSPNPLSEQYNYTRAPIRVPNAQPDTPPAAALAPLSASGIFQPQPDGSINFVVLTLAAYAICMVLRLVYYVYRRRFRPEVADPYEVTTMQALVTHHVWISILFPCTYHCGSKHLTLAVCSVMGMYAVVSCFITLGTKDMLRETQAQMLVGVFAAFTQVCLRPILNAMFFLFTTFDEAELLIAEKPVVFEFDEADYVEDIEILAPKHFEGEGIEMLDVEEFAGLNDDLDLKFQEMTMDDVLEKAAKEKVDFGGESGRQHLDAALELDNIIPDEDDADILLEQGFDDDADIVIDEEMIDVELEIEDSKAQYATAMSASSMENSRVSSAGEMTMTATSRGKTLANIGRELNKVHEADSNGSGDDNGSEKSPSKTDADLSYSDDAIVERHLHNYSQMGYAINMVYLALTALVTLLNSGGWSKPVLSQFWWSMIFAGISSFCLLEPLLMGLVWLYRWLIDEDDDPTVDMHPFEGEERLRIDA